jgi:hypothetical protein
MLRTLLAATVNDLCAAPRWQYADQPGSAQIVELAERLGSPSAYREFRATPEGDYLLFVVESFQDALNAEWMPFEIVGLQLNSARTFLAAVAEACRSEDLASEIPRLRSTYSELKANSQASDGHEELPSP